MTDFIKIDKNRLYRRLKIHKLLIISLSQKKNQVNERQTIRENHDIVHCHSNNE